MAALRILSCLTVLAISLWPQWAAAQTKGSKAKESKSVKEPARDKETPEVPADKPTAEKLIAAAAANPLPALLRDAGVRGELKLTAVQAKAVDKAVVEADYPIWRLREYKDAGSGAQAADLLKRLQDSLAQTLQPAQEKRLSELLLRTQGWASLVAPPIAERLKLSPEQLGKLRDIVKSARESTPPTADAAVQLQVNETLTGTQLQTLAQLAGKPFDAASVRRIYCQAPSIESVDEWINSPPLTMEKQRGKVTAVHFWTFGCINCIHNLPHYRSWHEKYADRGLTVLGFHTPETQGEHEIDNVRKNVVKRDIKYPVAIDNSGKNWYAYGNRLWPSVYLIDKQGFIRYWWSGELNWEGAKGEEWMRGKVEELLAE